MRSVGECLVVGVVHDHEDVRAPAFVDAVLLSLKKATLVRFQFLKELSLVPNIAEPLSHLHSHSLSTTLLSNS